MTHTRIKTNLSTTIETLFAEIGKLKDGMKSTVSEAAQYGKNVMFNLAPKDKRLTANAIDWSGSGKNATVIIREGHPNRVMDITTSKGTGGLTWYMNYGATSTKHWHSGNPRFIEKGKELTRVKLNRKLRLLVTGFAR